MAGAIELATIKTPVVADQKQFKQGMEEVKKTGKQVANQIEKQFDDASKNLAKSVDNAAKKIQKSLKATTQDAEKLTKSALNIYKDGYGKSMNDVVNSLNKTKKSMKDLEGEELETATKRAIELRDEMGVRLGKSLKMAKQEMEQYGSTAEQAFDRVEKRLKTTEAAWEKLGSKGEKLTTIGSALTAGVTVPLVGLGVAALKTAGDVETANARITSSLGLTQEQSAATKQALEQIFSDGYGESWDDVAESIIQVKQQLGDIPDDQIVKVTENALILRDTLGQDMGESLRGINSLMVNFGMDADSAMDLYVTGVQRGLDKTNELGDNLAEYGQLWSQAGFSAKDMFAVLENGLQSGAYNLDKVNDFVKEFTISLTDGRISDNLKKFSSGTKGVFKEFQKGKKTAQDVFKSVINDLENTENQQDKLTLAGTVWSALGEDNAMKIIESLNDVNDSYDDTADAMAKVKSQQDETFGSRSKALFRDAQTALLPLGEALLDIAERYMPKVEKAVDAFSDTLNSMSDEDIERVLKIGGFVALAGPTVVAIGKVTTGISTIGKTMKIASGLLGGGATSFGLLGSAASTAAGSGGIGAALSTGALLNPWVLGMVGTLAVGTAAWKLWGEEAYNSQVRTNKWGSDVGEDADKALTKFQDFSDGAILAMKGFEDNAVTSSASIEESVTGMLDNIHQAAEDAANKYDELIEKLPETAKEAAEKGAKEQESENAKRVELAETASAQIVDIYKKHADDHSKLTKEESQIVQQNMQTMVDQEIDLLSISSEKKAQIYKVLNGEISELTKSQASEYKETIKETISAEEESYKTQLSALKKSRSEGLLTDQEYYAEKEALGATHRKTEENLSDALLETYRQAGVYEGGIKTIFNQLGLDYEATADRVDNASDKIATSNEMLAQSAEGLSIEAQEANISWNDLILDDKTGEVKTNLTEFLSETAKSEDGWNQIEFIAKNANLTSNAREQIAISVGESGRWNDLDFDEKYLIANGDQAKIAFFDAINANGQWNQYESVIKEIGADNFSAIQAIFESDKSLKAWNELDPELKDIIVNDEASDRLIPGTELYKKWQRLPDSLKNIKINADTSGATRAQQALDSVRDKNVYISVKYKGASTGQTAINPNAKGSKGLPTDQLAMINDQKGPVYEELVTPPNGSPFIIPKQRDVVLPLKKGTRIDKAVDTRSILNSIPRFASGVGNQLPYDGYNASFIKRVSTKGAAADVDLSNVLRTLSKLLSEDRGITMVADNREMARGTFTYVDDFAKNSTIRKQRMRGEF